MPQRLPGTALRVRRGRRHDLEQIRAVLGAPASARLERVYRRILARRPPWAQPVKAAAR